MRIFWATRIRGFLRRLTNDLIDAEFINSENSYEINSLEKKIKSKIIRAKFLNLFGCFNITKIEKKDCDCYGSFNRFLDSDKPYFIYLENPTALYHYAIGRIDGEKGKKRFLNCLNNPNLRYIVCMSRACEETFHKINMELPDHVKMRTIYPLVPKNVYATISHISNKSRNEFLECLYCVQGIRFVSKGGLEVLSAFEQLRSKGKKINLTVITKISDLDRYTLRRLKTCEGVNLYDFNFSYSELEKIYANTNVLIQPASDESFGLTVLEAMKGGCAILSSKLYAFPEMVKESYNGFLVDPKYWFFDENNIPNPVIWNHRKKTIYSHRESTLLIENLVDRLTKFCDDRVFLKKCCENSLCLANTTFGENNICEQWKDVLLELSRK